MNKLVNYDSQGITVIEIDLSSVRKLRDGVIKPKKKNKMELIPNTDG